MQAGVYDVLVSILYLEKRSLKLPQIWARSTLGSDALLFFEVLPQFLLKIRSVRMLEMIVCSGTLLWLSSA